MAAVLWPSGRVGRDKPCLVLHVNLCVLFSPSSYHVYDTLLFRRTLCATAYTFCFVGGRPLCFTFCQHNKVHFMVTLVWDLPGNFSFFFFVITNGIRTWFCCHFTYLTDSEAVSWWHYILDDFHEVQLSSSLSWPCKPNRRFGHEIL